MCDNVLWCVLQAETRAEFAERSVAKLEKTIDDLEGIQHSPVVSANTSTDTSNMPACCPAVNNLTVTNNFTDPSSTVEGELTVMIARIKSPQTQLLVI